MQRRGLLKLGIGTAVLATLAGSAMTWWRPGWTAGRLTPDGRAIFAALSRAVLGPALGSGDLNAQTDRIEAAILAFPPHLQADLGQLLALLATPPTRLALTGLTTEWTAASDAALARMLQRLRESPIEVRRQVYHALRDLCCAAWFAAPHAWQTLGYPGPRNVAA